MSWAIPRIWDEGDVWILGGGPSIPKVFNIPEAVVQKVLLGQEQPSIYSPYMKVIHQKHVIGINVSYLIGDWIDVAFFGDHSFFLKHQYGLAEFPGLKVSCDPHTHVSWVKTVLRDPTHVKGISENPRAVSWNHNSGAAAISLAVHAGAKRIMLLGFDMKLDAKQQQHWHDLYHNMPASDPRRRRKLPFDYHLLSFPQIAKDAKRMGIEIYNLSPDSAITQFPKMTLQDVL